MDLKENGASHCGNGFIIHLQCVK